MKICSFEDCGRQMKCLGLCASHYSQQKQGKELTPLQQRKGRYRPPKQKPWTMEDMLNSISQEIAKNSG